MPPPNMPMDEEQPDMDVASDQRSVEERLDDLEMRIAALEGKEQGEPEMEAPMPMPKGKKMRGGGDPFFGG